MPTFSNSGESIHSSTMRSNGDWQIPGAQGTVLGRLDGIEAEPQIDAS